MRPRVMSSAVLTNSFYVQKHCAEHIRAWCLSVRHMLIMCSDNYDSLYTVSRNYQNT